MAAPPPQHSELGELARCLRQERLYVSYEKKQLQQLNEQLATAGRRLAQSAWTTFQQRENLEGLVMSRGNSSPQLCCQRANLLQQAHFTDAYKLLSHQMVSYSEYLAALRANPALVAICLASGDSLSLPNMPEIVATVFSSLLGACVLPEDEAVMMTILHKLVDIQLLKAANPRKLLRHGTSSFSRLYKFFTDQLFTARLFLTSALYEPILCLLTDDEVFLDIDPSKAVIRFPPQERLRRFGQEGTEEYVVALAAHRKHIITKLAGHARRFMMGIRANMHCLPGFLSALIRNIFASLERSTMEPKEAWAVCTDILFNSFICPAIVDPEPKGIIDMPISHIARFNLMQVAQILQVLALWKWEEIQPAQQDLYQELDTSVVPALLEGILASAGEVVENQDGPSSTGRLAVLVTADQLQGLTEWLRAVRDRGALEGEVASQLTSLLQPLPPTVPGRRRAKVEGGVQENQEVEVVQEQNFGQRQKTALAAKLSSVGGMKAKQGSPSNRQQQGPESIGSSALDKVLVLPISESQGEMPGLAGEEAVLSKSRESGGPSSSTGSRVRMNMSGLEEGSLTSASGEVQEKRTRFSLSHDEQGSTTSDNLEAISEAASNHSVASSLEDEVDPVDPLDPIIDNLSDMVSANVSGRGTPNVSGRDTPSSQVTEGEEPARILAAEREPEEVERAPIDLMGEAVSPQVPGQYQGRKNPETDMEEKFGRFEIKPEVRRGRLGQLCTGSRVEGERDEAVSMVSDTWSTDVLGSDTETLGEPPTLEDLLRGRPGDEFHVRGQHQQLQVPAGGDGGGQGAAAHLLDVAETGSEAWSMDVLASDFGDSARLGDFDLEDSMSVQSGVTTRSDPDHINLQRLELSGAEGGSGGAHYHPVRSHAAVEQWAKSSGQSSGQRRDSDGSQHSRLHESILKKPSGAVSLPVVASSSVEPPAILDESVTDGASETSVAPENASNLSTTVRVSTTSIASSASSHGSGGSTEVVPLGIKSGSRSNSSASGAGAQGPIGAVGGAVPAPSANSTGAIPKSISFDKTADKEDESLGDLKHGSGRNFFKNLNKSWKLPKIGRRGGGARGSKGDDYHRSADRLTNDAFHIPEHAEGPILRRASSDDTGASTGETSDDILAKYRKKSLAEDKADGAEMVAEENSRQEQDDQDAPLHELDRDNLEVTFVFQDARRKLRLVLSEVELPVVQGGGEEREVVGLLEVMLAQAINQQDRSAAAQLRETLRCLSLFDQDGCTKLVRSLLEEYRRRSPYIAYLVRSRQGLLSSLATLEKVALRLENEQRMSSKFLITVCVRLFLERREDELVQLKIQFSSTNVMDEKTDLVVQFLSRVWEALEQEPMLAATSEDQREEARKAVERAIFSEIYMAALFPNIEADISRDHVLQQHIGRLSEVVSPNHRDLKIPKRYQYECPWPAAQAELRRLAAFKLPADKVHCISRVSAIIMNLLSLAQDKAVPAADDFVPVLVYVIIKANPPSLLSTVQYVDNFYRDRLCGEECYWWMQFVGAVEFIKTME